MRNLAPDFLKASLLILALASFHARAQNAKPPASAASAPAQDPTSRPTSQPTDDAVKVLHPFEDVTVILNRDQPRESRVEIKGFTCLDSGWLEQVACGPASREHESLVVIKARPSQIHAALLTAGFESGKPGRWTYDNDKLGAIDPTGEKVDILVRYVDKTGKTVEHEIGKWIRGQVTEKDPGKPFPREPFVFGGSAIAKNTPDMAPAGAKDAGEHYVADMTGSVIGLVTFGDEMIGFSRVMADQESVQEPAWEANTETLPPVETPVTVIIRKWKD